MNATMGLRTELRFHKATSNGKRRFFPRSLIIRRFHFVVICIFPIITAFRYSEISLTMDATMGLRTELRFHKAEMFFFTSKTVLSFFGKRNNQQGEPTVIRRLKLGPRNAATSLGTLFQRLRYKVDLPQVDLMNFRVEYVRPQSGRCLGREAAKRERSLKLAPIK